MIGKKHSGETRAKMSSSRVREQNLMFGLKHSDETKAKMSISKARKKHLGGEKHPMFGNQELKELVCQLKVY